MWQAGFVSHDRVAAVHQTERRNIMKSEKIVRSWKDEDYRLSLSGAEQSLLPVHPSGLIELTDTELQGAGGGETQWALEIDGPSHVGFCIPSMDFALCSLFGNCITWGQVFCPY
jgi:mersacidin/lichenicidin family type 2 lantibiotic